MIAIVIAALLTTSPTVARDSRGKILRHRTPIAAFMKAQPCPYPPDVGSTKRCRNGRVDHVVPLCAGGADDPSNMQWQTIEAAHQKDRLEVWICRRDCK